MKRRYRRGFVIRHSCFVIHSSGITDARNERQFVKVLKKILLIDNETRVTRTVRRALERAGKYSIREEHDAVFAVHAAHWFQPDLIVVDLTNAATNGEVIAHQLQKDRNLCHVPLLCLSKLVSGRQFMSAGILRGYSFLAVPVKIEQLLRGVEHLLFGKD
jgi:DNA-binding response OmpR family regulator